MEFKTIAFDVMGSDNGLIPAVDAAIKLLYERNDLKIIFVGNEIEINELLKTKKYDKKRIEIFNTTEVIEMTDGIMDIRRKKNSSMVKAIELVKNGKADAVASGGATAPFIAGCVFILKTLEGVKKTAFMPVMPTIKTGKVVLLLDAGANSENSGADLEKFASMANAYAKVILGVVDPKIGLLNVGEEKTKGLDYHREAYELMSKNSSINFVGNVESRELASGDVDILVSDGLTGNITLKAIEGMAKNLMKEIKAAITKTFFRKLKALGLRKAFKEVAAKFDYKNHAGAILLGLNNIAFKSHGSSDMQSFHATLRMTYEAIKNDVINKIKSALKVN